MGRSAERQRRYRDKLKREQGLVQVTCLVPRDCVASFVEAAEVARNTGYRPAAVRDDKTGRMLSLRLVRR